MRPLPVKVKQINSAIAAYLDYPLARAMRASVFIDGSDNHAALILEKLNYLSR
jgi:hypothetical protein